MEDIPVGKVDMRASVGDDKDTAVDIVDNVEALVEVEEVDILDSIVGEDTVDMEIEVERVGRGCEDSEEDTECMGHVHPLGMVDTVVPYTAGFDLHSKDEELEEALPSVKMLKCLECLLDLEVKMTLK